MPAKTIVKQALGLFIGTLLIATLFVIGARVRVAYGSPEKATVGLAFHKMAVRGQVKAKRQAHRVIRRQRAELRRLRRSFNRDLGYSIRLAHALYGVPTWEMWTVTRCENPRGDRHARNRSSGAYSWWQYLDSTWRNQGLAGFSAADPVASTLNTARIVAQQGWRQWSCRP